MPLDPDEQRLVADLMRGADLAAASHALAALMDRYKRLVYAIAFDLARDQSLADDVFQETFVRLTIWIRNHPDARIESFRRLLAAFVRRTTLELGRAGRRTGSADEQSVESAVIEQIYAAELLDLLSPQSRRVLELTVIRGLSSQEAATRLQLSAENVRVIKHRAIRLIRQQQRKDLDALQ